MEPLLDQIQSPGDLKKLSREQLEQLAGELRRFIVEVVSKNGGHLASSLGAVELTIALHYVFNTPTDRIVWDVGHQAYAHKILTGRRDRFPTLRKLGGISGFTRSSESVYDCFTTGHSSTSISSALGMACAKNLRQENSKVVAVIGDGSLTAGMAFEGLNQAGDLKKDLVVILNDNDMSIAPNVGALSSFLSRKFSAKRLQSLRKEFGDWLRSVPKIGDDIYHLAKRSEESFKSFVTPGSLFEAFNFEYFGPIDGHNMGHLIDILNNIAYLKDPVLLHITTRKGKGYAPAEKNPVYFHGVGCFEIETGNCVINNKTVPTYTAVFGQSMLELAADNPEIVAVTAAMPEGTGLLNFAEAYPDRFYDVGIAEQHGVTFAAGLASEGLRPVVAIYSTFLQRAYDQILHDVCLENLPVVFALDRGGIVGEDGPTHHGLFDIAYLRSLPNMTVMAPKDENELRQMIWTAFMIDGPVAIRYPRGSAVGVTLQHPPRPISLGQAEIIRHGTDLLMIGLGATVQPIFQAAESLQSRGITATVINSRFVKPLDAELICDLAKDIPRVVTVEEHMRQGGFGSAVLECLHDRRVKNADVLRIGIADTFVAHGSQAELRALHGLDAAGIEKTVQQHFFEDI